MLASCLVIFWVPKFYIAFRYNFGLHHKQSYSHVFIMYFHLLRNLLNSAMMLIYFSSIVITVFFVLVTNFIATFLKARRALISNLRVISLFQACKCIFIATGSVNRSRFSNVVYINVISVVLLVWRQFNNFMW